MSRHTGSALARKGQRDRVGAEERPLAAVRHGDAVGVREGHPDQAFARRSRAYSPIAPQCEELLTPTAPMPLSRASSIASRFARWRDDDAVALVAFDLRGARPGRVTRSRPRLDRAARQAVEVVRQPRDAMRVDAPQAGLHEAGGDAARRRRRRRRCARQAANAVRPTRSAARPGDGIAARLYGCCTIVRASEGVEGREHAALAQRSGPAPPPATSRASCRGRRTPVQRRSRA